MTTKFTEAEYVQESQVLESEIHAGLHELANGKAPGGDGIPVELIKAAGNDAVTANTRLCRRIIYYLGNQSVARGLEVLSIHTNPQEGRMHLPVFPCISLLAIVRIIGQLH